MKPKERMFHAIERTIKDLAAMQDVLIKLTRDIHEIHAAKEHEHKLKEMKEFSHDLKEKMDAMQEFLYSCEKPTESSGRTMSEVDIA